jgi:hypothetical protein
MRNPAFAIPRNESRIRVDLPVRLRFGWKWSEEIGAEAIDISTGGMRVRCHAPLRLGLDVEAVLAGGTEDTKYYRVIWVRDSASTPHAFDIGFALNSEVSAKGTSIA